MDWLGLAQVGMLFLFPIISCILGQELYRLARGEHTYDYEPDPYGHDYERCTDPDCPYDCRFERAFAALGQHVARED